MPKKFMANIGLRCVQRFAVMPNVLSGKKHAKGQRVEEVARRQKATHRTESKPGATLSSQLLGINCVKQVLQTFKKSEMWLICGMESREKPHFSRMTGKMYWYSWHA
jgi:hypothetical protein